MHDRRFGGLFWGAAALLVVGSLFSLASIAGDPADVKKVATATTSTTTTTAEPTPSTTTTTIDPFVASFGTVKFTITSPARSDVPATVKEGCALLATTAEQLARGLMDRSDLAGFDAMVFRFDRDLIAGFYMKNVKAPLNIAWFDSNGRIIGSTTMPVCPPEAKNCPTYKPSAPFRTAMETFQGGLAQLGVGQGSVVTYSGGCSPGA